MRTPSDVVKQGVIGGVVALLCFANFATAPVAAQNQTGVPLDEARAEAYSIVRYLALAPHQIERLDGLYDAFGAMRFDQESRIAGWQEELKRAQSPATLNERKANDLLRNISGAQQKIAAAFLQARGAALQDLSPVERAQLESLSRRPRQLRDDKYRQLLLGPVESILQTSLQSSMNTASQRQRNERRRHVYGSYGVYGGYGYGGPNYGVTGSVGSGAVAVHGGYGRYGPSVGVGIGRVFGGIFR